MILNSVELNIYPNKNRSTFDGRFYYNACDISTLKKILSNESLGLARNAILDACSFARQTRNIEAEDGILIYDYVDDTYGYDFDLNEKNKLFAGVKNLNAKQMKDFLSYLVQIIIENEMGISFYLSFNNKIYLLYDRFSLSKKEDIDSLVEKAKDLMLYPDGILPRKVVKQDDLFTKADEVIETLELELSEKQEMLEKLEMQKEKCKYLREEKTYIERQIKESQDKLRDLMKDE